MKNFVGHRVMCYYDLHRKTFSVTYKNKLIFKSDYVILDDVEFRVRKRGNERVRAEKRKNVHAFVIGNLVDYKSFPLNEKIDEPQVDVVTYDPYKYDSFVKSNTLEPIFYTSKVLMLNSKNKLFLID